MVDMTSRLRKLPRVDDILSCSSMASLTQGMPRLLARQAAREAIEETRARLLAGEDVDAGEESVAGRAAEIMRRKKQRSPGRAVNATGIVLHTGLGRSPLSDAAGEALAEVSAGFCNVQTDVATGQRMHREAHVDWLFREIAGAEDAVVVNNNAAATVLVLNTLARGREVIVSRGEMVEIGGSFRIPEIMELAGCRLVDVGCTNKTHLEDYEKAITAETALILSVHQSNYAVKGFASQVGIAELAALAHEKGLLCVHDLGSGALADLTMYGLPHEPSVPESLDAGADVTLFSGDKLLGGPQCGIILGKRDLLADMRKNQLYRVFRVGKLTLAALEATLRLFLEPEDLPRGHRLMAMLTRPLEDIRRQADELARGILEACGDRFSAETRENESEVGGGSLAGESLPTVVVRLRSDSISTEDLASRLRRNEPPVFARIHKDHILIDPRTVLPGECEIILDAVRRIGEALSG